MNLAKHLEEDRRLCVLRILADQTGYTVNESVMQAALELVGHRLSRDMVQGLFSWLKEQGLVRVEELSYTLHVASITQRGLDVQSGLSTHPGVKRPRPGA